ncbi:hypothetical protein LPJ73_006838, partial [Coemansia sp. RSA 2703]
NYYDNTLIHRNIRGFLVQMGDPQGTGKGGTSIWGRKFSDEPHPALKHDRRGTVSMAGAGADSNGSQFFITYACQPSLDGTYGVFGRVIDGEETLAAMERVEVGKKYRPVEEIRLKSVTIHANPLADPSCIHSSQPADSHAEKDAAKRDDDEVLHRDPSYFQYYSQLQHQNMLQDHVRTSAYHSAITFNGPSLFRDRLVMDVGAGSGILSFFAAQAGAKHIYAVEASGMARKMQLMLDSAKPGAGSRVRNAYLADRITIVSAKIEEPSLLSQVPQVDAIISEPIGVLLVHERMLESFVYARDKFLRPGGAMLPSSGTIHLAPLSDAALWNETITKARFWQQEAFYGVDINPYFAPSLDEYFSSPVVGCFSPTTLMSDSAVHPVDFHTVTMSELKEFVVRIEWHVGYTGVMHGVAGWFDLAFVPPV